MSDEKKYTEKTEVKTETKGKPGESKHTEETTVKTERKVEKDKDPTIIIEEK